MELSDIDHCLLKDKIKLQKKLKHIEQIEDDVARKDALQKFKKKLQHAQSLYQQRNTKLDLQYPDLPIMQAKAEILEALQQHQVVIVAGETGSGKSTQLAKLCLELGRGIEGWIGHTQPRRLAARAIADRVAQELNEPLGHTIGYKVRFNEVVNPLTRIKVMTDGILLNELSFDKYLYAYDTIIIDEAHERSLNIDLLLGFIKSLLKRRADLKLIITSATIELEAFSKFFDDAPVIQVSGRTYPVDIHYMTQDESQDLFTDLLDTVALAKRTTSKDILVFLSGEGEIHLAKKLLSQKFYQKIDILPLYARLSLQDQRKVFNPGKQQRVILATNVAETSITVPNIGCVIDSGFARISRYSYRSKIQRLPIERISQSAATQRSGRAGRVAHGICYRLFSEQDFIKRDPYNTPEILRTNLASVILQMIQLRLGDIAKFPFINPPDMRLVRDGIKQLERLQAIKHERLTQEGKHMATMPIEPKLAKILIYAQHHHCLKEVLIIVSGLCLQDPRQYPQDHQEAARQQHSQYQDPSSSFMSYLLLWEHLKTLKAELSASAFRKHCQTHFISFVRYLEWLDVYDQLKNLCKQKKFKTNEKEATYEQIHKALLSGLFETVGVLSPEDDCYVGPRNIKFHVPKTTLKKKAKWVMAFNLVETKKVFAHTAAAIEPQWIESVAKHLCKYEPGTLFWDAQSGYVKAYEKVSFFGLILSAKRKAPIRHDLAPTARQVFIQQALMDAQLPQFDFWRHNHKIVQHLLDLEQRQRRLGSVFNQEALFEHYARALDDDIYSVKALAAHIKAKGDKHLYIQADSVSLLDNLAEIEQAFPDDYVVDGHRIPLSYVFDLTSEADGVSLSLTLEMAQLLRHHDFSWGIPGFLNERLIWLLEKMPIEYRRVLPSQNECLAILPQAMDRSVPFIQAFKQAIASETGINVPLNTLEAIEFPTYLQIRFICLEDDTVLYQGRDVKEMFLQLAPYLPERASAAVKHEAITTWDFGDLPEQEKTMIQQQSTILFPALVDNQSSVSIEYFNQAEVANHAHEKGVLRLFMLVEQKSVTYLKKNVKYMDWLKKHAKAYVEYPSLLDDIVSKGFYQTFIMDKPMIRTAEAFESRLQTCKPELVLKTQQITQLCAQSFTLLGDIRQAFYKIQREKGQAFAENVADIEQQLDCLIKDGFVATTPFEWLVRYPIYLKGLQQRMQKLLENPMQDSKRLAMIKPLIKAYQQICQDRTDEACLNYHWYLEEYRLTLFAQNLKPKLSVSEKKMKTWLKDLR